VGNTAVIIHQQDKVSDLHICLRAIVVVVESNEAVQGAKAAHAGGCGCFDA